MESMYSHRLSIAVLPLVLAVGLALASAADSGLPEGVIVKVDKPVSVEALSQVGMLFLADIGDAYLVQGSRVATDRLGRATHGFKVITPVSPGKDVYLLRPKSPADELLYSGALIEIGKGMYLAKLDADEINDLRLLPFSKARLKPRPFARRQEPMQVQAPAVITPKPEIASIVAQVSGDTLWKYIAELSGGEPVLINGVLDTLLTRFTFNWRIEHAADYLRERFEEHDVDVEFQEYVQGRYDLYDVDFIDESYGWVVGYTRMYKTTDGGLTWARKKTGAFNQVYLDVCFLDSLEGWIVGVPGIVYHTTDGGASWINQPYSGSMTWIYDVFFVDSLSGWIAGQDGGIAITTDGGQTWTTQTSGTSENLYGLWFTSVSRGWACGAGGTILFWDGVSWTAQTSGVSDFLRDVCFVDGNTGWTVGADRAMLKTIDGGQNWSAMPVPSSPNPYLMDVCFVDSSEGWVDEYDGTILHTTDGGATWEIQHAEGAPALYGIDFVSASHGWCSGLSSAIQHTGNGGTTWTEQTTNLPSGAWTIQKNVVATKPGTVSDEQVIICGHYDSISQASNTLAPGADDNASGVAAVLEAARLLAPGFYERTVKFVCFPGEEQGLCGSSEYAGRALNAGDVIVGVLNLDMIGYVDVAPEDVDVTSDSASEWLADFAIDCANAYVPTLSSVKNIDPGMIYSDHASFWRLGYQAVDCAEDTPIVYPDYHTTGDTLGNLDQPFVTDVVKMALAAVAELAVPDTTARVTGRPEIAAATSAYPNPFRAQTKLSFALSSAGKVNVSVFDIEGRLVKSLIGTSLGPGRHAVVWDGTDDQGSKVSPGVYFAGVKTERASKHTKVVLLR